MTSNDIAFKSLRNEIEAIRKLIPAAETKAIYRYYSSYLLPPSGNIPRGSTDEDRICEKDEWNGSVYRLTTIPTTIPGTHLQKIKLNSSANGIKVRIKFVIAYDSAANTANGIATFQMSWRLAWYEGTSLITAQTGDSPITKKTKSDSGFRTNDLIEQDLSFQYVTHDGSNAPTFNANGDLPIKGYPSTKHVELDVQVKGREYSGSHQVQVYLANFGTISSQWGWIADDGTVNSSDDRVVAPMCEIIEF